MEGLEKVVVRKATNEAKDGRLIEIARGRAQVEDFCEGREQITGHALKPGEIGGDHYHKIKEETIYFIYGDIELYLRDIESGKEKTRIRKSGEIVYIPTKVFHSLKNPSKTEMVVFLETSNLAFNPNDERNDVYTTD